MVLAVCLRVIVQDPRELQALCRELLVKGTLQSQINISVLVPEVLHHAGSLLQQSWVALWQLRLLVQRFSVPTGHKRR